MKLLANSSRAMRWHAWTQSGITSIFQNRADDYSIRLQPGQALECYDDLCIYNRTWRATWSSPGLESAFGVEASVCALSCANLGPIKGDWCMQELVWNAKAITKRPQSLASVTRQLLAQIIDCQPAVTRKFFHVGIICYMSVSDNRCLRCQLSHPSGKDNDSRKWSSSQKRDLQESRTSSTSFWQQVWSMPVSLPHALSKTSQSLYLWSTVSWETYTAEFSP